MTELGLEIICRDELKGLERLCESIRDVDFGDRVAVWSGEDHKVYQVLEENCFRIIKITWPGRFDDPRNRAHDSLTTPWAFWLDSDDTLENASELSAVFEEMLNSPHRGVGLHYEYRRDEHGLVCASQVRERILERSETLWIGAISESCERFDGATQLMVDPERIFVRHHSNLGDARTKLRRNIEIAERYPDGYRSLWVLADCYRGLGQLEKAVEFWWLYVAEIKGPEWKYSALLMIARTLMQLEKYDDAIRTAERAAGLFPQYCEPFFIVAEVYYRTGHARNAVLSCVEGFQRRQPELWPISVDRRHGTLYPHRLYAMSLAAVGWHYEAVQVATNLLVEFPGDPVLSEVIKQSAVTC